MGGDKLTDKECNELLGLTEQLMPLYFLDMNRSQSLFIRVKNRVGVTPKRRLYEAGNKSGKTRMGIAEDLAHAFGFRVWLEKDDPDYLIKIKVPNTGLIAGETIVHSIGEKLEPELRYLVPSVCCPEWKPGSSGYLLKLKLKYNPLGGECNSTIYLRSYDQKPSTFEGIDYDWVHFDEPPPEPILKAVERGKISSNARSWYTMTPIKEAYLWSLFSERAATVC